MYTRKDFDSLEFEKKFHYNGPLGVMLDQNTTEFRLWAPTAEKVVLHLYEKGNDSPVRKACDMICGEQGVWSRIFAENLNGIYYDYDVTVDGITRKTGDPYAVAAGVNGIRSMVLDLSQTDPEGWQEDRAPGKTNENIIYEIHIKDFSWDPCSGIADGIRGKFKALCVSDSTLNGDGIHPTCVNYLKKLGVTHVQLMPACDYGSVDESGDDLQFNWGYDPWNYNLPEGSYSTDPYHGEVRIREMKEAVAALHRQGFRVIMDVVYNHTYRLDSVLWRTVPWYFYRQEDDDSASNGSGCSNDLASERSMCSRYILDSVLYWTREYHIDGFRFDLMGLLDAPLMNRIRHELDKIYGENEKIIFGEPWRARATSSRPGTMLSDKEAFSVLDRNVGAFCDATRDAVKGDLMKENSQGFANGGSLDAVLLGKCLTGWMNSGEEFSVQAPSQTVTYLSSHDDWTLWDRLIFSLDPVERRFDASLPELLQANRLAAAICICCQGNLFMLSGEEFARTKYGIRDSVRSPLEINRLNWKKAWENQELSEYYRGLIALRKQLPGLCDKTSEASGRLLECKNIEKDCVLARIYNENEGGSSRWKELILLANASHEIVTVSLPDGFWQPLFDGIDSFLWQKEGKIRNVIDVPAKSAVLLGWIER